METLSASEAVAKNVRRIREARSLRQIDLARLLGWSTATLSKLEAGARGVGVDDLLALAAALGVAPAYLVCPWTEEEGQLVVRLRGGNEELMWDPREAVAWIAGEAAPMPFTDPRDYFWTIPPSQQKRRNEILARLEAEGIVEFPDKHTVVFRSGGVIARSTRPQEEE